MRRNKITEIIKYFIKIKFEADGKKKNKKINKLPIYQETVKNKKKIKYKQKKSIFSVNKIETKKNKNTKESPKKPNNKKRNNEKAQNKKKNLKKEKKKNNFPPKKKKNINHININNNISS